MFNTASLEFSQDKCRAVEMAFATFLVTEIHERGPPFCAPPWHKMTTSRLSAAEGSLFFGVASKIGNTFSQDEPPLASARSLPRPSTWLLNDLAGGLAFIFCTCFEPAPLMAALSHLNCFQLL